MSENILISREGQQLGPYSLHDARSLVLNGSISAGDWAWYDGATDWVPLNQVPGFTVISHAPPVHAPAPQIIVNQQPAAQTSQSASVPNEEQIWKGSPSRWLMLKSVLFWLMVFFALIIAMSVVDADTRSAVALIFLITGLLAAIQIILGTLMLRSTTYIVTNQRVKVMRGILSKSIDEIELFRAKDTSVQQSFFLRILGRGNLTILSGDAKNPLIVLWAIPKAMELREKLRQHILSLRQRYNVRELDVM